MTALAKTQSRGRTITRDEDKLIAAWRAAPASVRQNLLDELGRGALASLESEPVAKFLAACIEKKNGARIQSSVMHRAFCAWATLTSEPPMSPKRLWKHLVALGLTKRKSDWVFWLNVRFTAYGSDIERLAGASKNEWEGSSVDDDTCAYWKWSGWLRGDA
jgi:hypothetical protein